MARQPFVWGQGGRKMTPEEVDRQRLVAQALLARGSDFSPAGHWTEALGRAFSGWASGRLGNLARQGEEAGMAGAREAITASPVLSALMGGSGVPGAAPSVASIPGGDMAATIRQGLIARGLPEHVADGFLMNFQDESGLNPGINEISPLVPGSRGGFGLYQLTGPRRTAYEAFAAERGVDPADVDAQLDFLMTELQGPEAAAAQSIFGAPDAGSAAAAIARDFLRPAPEHLQRRVSRYTGQPGSSFVQPNQNVVAALMQAQADPWVQKAYGPQLGALMQQQMGMQNAAYEQQLRQQDPMYQAQMQRAQLELEAMRNPREKISYQFAPNGQLIAINETQGVVSNLGEYAQSPQAQSAIAKIRADLNAGLISQEDADIAISKLGNQINLNMGGAPELGKLSTDYAYVHDAEGKPVIDPETGLPKAAPVPGSPAAMAAAKEAASADKRETNAANTASIVLQDINKAIDLTSGWTAGFGGRVLGSVPGSGATDLRASMDSIKANIGFDRLQQMREASPTGGALGGIAVPELQMLQAVLGSLDQSQSPEQLRANLQRLKEIYEPIAAKAAAYPNAAEFGFGGGVSSSGGGIPRVTDKASYDALPSGSEYIAPDGSRRRKP